MKTKIKCLGLALLVGTMFASCKKTYECHCNLKAGGETHVDVKATKADSEKACTDLAEGSSTYSACHLE